MKEVDRAARLPGWTVRSIEVVEEGRAVDVVFAVDDRTRFRFRTKEFGIGGRDARTAALARFAARAGYGDVRTVFEYLSRMPRDNDGNAFPCGSLGARPDDPAEQELRDLYTEYHGRSECVLARTSRRALRR